MAQDTIQLEIVAPEREPIRLELDEVCVPGAEGVFTVLPGHTPVLSTLAPGVVAAYRERTAQYLAVHGGFAEVLDDRVAVLTVAVEWAEEVDIERAEAARDRAEKRLKDRHDVDVQRAEAALARALARIEARAKAR